MLELNGKVAFVTGGGGLIGSEVCRTLARQGAAVAAADVVPEKAQAAADSVIAAGGKAIALPLDVTDYDDVEAKIARTVETFGRLDISVHVAGGASGSRPACLTMSFLTGSTFQIFRRIQRKLQP